MISIEIIVLWMCIFRNGYSAPSVQRRRIVQACVCCVCMDVVQESKLPVHGVKNASVVFKLSGFYLHIKMYVSGIWRKDIVKGSRSSHASWHFRFQRIINCYVLWLLRDENISLSFGNLLVVNEENGDMYI